MDERLLAATDGQWRTELKSRRRAVKGRRKRCHLIALDARPETGCPEVLVRRLADSKG